MPPTSLPIRRRNAVRRRRQGSSPQQEQQQQQPSASPQQQQQQHQQQQQQPTGGGPQTLARPFSFDGRGAITTQPTSSTLATQQRANANPQPVPVPVPGALAAQAAGSTKGSEAKRACSSSDRGQNNYCAPERPDHHSSSFHDESWTSAYEDSALTGNESSNYQLGPVAERQSRSMIPGPQVRDSTWRKLIPSNPFAKDDDDDNDQKEDEQAEAATRACRDENEAGDLNGEDSRPAGVISRCYGSSSKELDNLPAVPRARRERSSSSLASVVSDVSESSGRRSVSPIGGRDGGGNLKPRRRRRRYPSSILSLISWAGDIVKLSRQEMYESLFLCSISSRTGFFLRGSRQQFDMWHHLGYLGWERMGTDEDFARKPFEPPASLVTQRFGAPVLSHTHRRVVNAERLKQSEKWRYFIPTQSSVPSLDLTLAEPRPNGPRPGPKRPAEMVLERGTWPVPHSRVHRTTLYIAQSSDQGLFHFLS
ncbi:hypothetical protein QBC37DRAFT_452967 [Rhypophila decipiens]|uniref:Uncharacterized protein n=1 Tax=Rhypophila decipiens TaxID=261697 RepID=A0AAN6YHN3_9PEZI|nr:hypothetical protein QBC37DRAFT_452967 [Rhypophila decipiens]